MIVSLVCLPLTLALSLSLGACDGTCNATQFEQCDVEVPEDSGRWQKAGRTVAAKCARNSFCQELLDEIEESEDCCPRLRAGGNTCEGFGPVGQCSIECAATIYMEFATECLNYGFRGNDTTARNTMDRTRQICRSNLLRHGAEVLYADSRLSYVPYGGLLLFVLPLFFFSVFIFFGKQLATMFRMLVGGLAVGFAVAWPTVSPYLASCEIWLDGSEVVTTCSDALEFQPSMVITFGLAILIFFQSAYTCRQVTVFGNAVQGFTLGVIFIILMLNILIVRDTATQKSVETSWLLLGMYLTMGLVGAVANIFHPTGVNILASTMIGSYVCCQIVCIIGYFQNWFFTFPVSVMAASMGVAGCQDGWCWLYVLGWVLVGFVGCVSQVHASETAQKVDKGELAHGCWERFMYVTHHAVELVLDMESSMAEHADYHTAEEMAELAAHHAATWAKVATFTSDTCIMMFGFSLFVGTIELFARGIDVPVSLGVYICASALTAMVFTVYEMSIHNTATVSVRIRKFDVYIWGVFVLIPVSVTGFLVCMSLGMQSDPLGLHDNFGVDQLTDAPCDGSDYCIGQAQRTMFFRHMQAAAFAYMGLIVSACLTVTYVSRHLGGMLYLALKVTKFVAFLLIGYGAVFIVIGVVFVPPEGSGFDGAWLYTAIAVIGAVECLTGIMGIAGACAHAKKGDKERQNQKSDVDETEDTGNGQEATKEEREREAQTIKLLRIFAGLLALIMLMNMWVFLAAGGWAAEVDTMSDSEWLQINGTGGPLQSYCNQVGEPLETCMVTREQFQKDITASFQLLMAAGITVIAYMMVGLGASVFVMLQKPGVLSHAEELVAKHAKDYIDEVTAATLRDRHGKMSGLQKVETVRVVAAERPKAKKRRRAKKNPDETPEERAARKERHKQKKQQAATTNGEFRNPVSEPGAVFDVEGSQQVATGDGDSGDSSEYEWATTDSDNEAN